MQRTTMGRIERRTLAAANSGEASAKPAFGAVAVQQVYIEPAGQFPQAKGRCDIGRTQHPRDGQPVNAKARAVGERSELCFGLGIGGQAVGNDADFVPTLGKAAGKIGHMAEQPAHRRAHDLKDPHGRHRPRASVRK